jgi:uncharacterized protein
VAVDDELSTPLGQHKIRKPPLRRSRLLLRLIAGALSLWLVVFGGWAMIVDNPYGGEPVATAFVDVKQATLAAQAAKEGSGKSVLAALSGPVDPALPPGAKVVNIIDGSSGKREQVIIPSFAFAAPDAAPAQRPQRAAAQKPR